MGLLSAGLLGSSAGSVDLFFPPKALIAGRGSVLLATVFSILVGGYLGGFQSLPINRVEPIKSVIVLPTIVTAIFADLLEMALAEESIGDLDSRSGHDFIY